jgi:hypothetical protein
METVVELIKDYSKEYPEINSLIQYAIECQKIYELTLIAMGEGPKISINKGSSSMEGKYYADVSGYPQPD